jgi:hypothetical protein
LAGRHNHLNPHNLLHNNSTPTGVGGGVSTTSFTAGTLHPHPHHPWPVLPDAGHSGLSSAQPSSSAFAMPSVTTLLVRHGSNAEGLLVRHESTAEAEYEEGPRSLLQPTGVPRMAATAGTATGVGTAGTASIAVASSTTGTGNTTGTAAGSSPLRPAGIAGAGVSRLSSATEPPQGPGPVAEGVEQQQYDNQGQYSHQGQYSNQANYNPGQNNQGQTTAPVTFWSSHATYSQHRSFASTTQGGGAQTHQPPCIMVLGSCSDASQGPLGESIEVINTAAGTVAGSALTRESAGIR